MIIICPHCDNDFNIENAKIEEMQKERYIVNYECPECGKMLDICVEMIWTGEGVLVEKEICDCCNRSIKKSKVHRRDTCYPYPTNKLYNTLCPNCFVKAMYNENEYSHNATKTKSQEEIAVIREKFTTGIEIKIFSIKDNPSYCFLGPETMIVEGVDNSGIVYAKNIADDIFKLTYGYDEFELLS